MGVIIFADDDTKYRTGDHIVMYGDMTVSPTVPDTTFIYHTDKFTEKDAIMWASIIPYRMVVVGKLPKLTKASEHCVIVDQQVKVKQDYSRSIRAALCWADRDRAHRALDPVPIPLANAFVRVNVGSGRGAHVRVRLSPTASPLYATSSGLRSPTGPLIYCRWV